MHRPHFPHNRAPGRQPRPLHHSSWAPKIAPMTSSAPITRCDALQVMILRLAVPLSCSPRCISDLVSHNRSPGGIKGNACGWAASACIVGALNGCIDLSATHNSVWCTPSTTRVPPSAAAVAISMHQRLCISQSCPRGTTSARLDGALPRFIVCPLEWIDDLNATHNSV